MKVKKWSEVACIMAFSSVLQMYLGWANSLLCEQGILIDGLHQLRNGSVFCHLIELLTGTQLLPADQDALTDLDDTFALDSVQIALDYLTGVGVKINVTAEGVVCGELKSILDVMWCIILHCTIHSPERAMYQRTVRMGRKLLLQWCGGELNINIDGSKSMTAVFSCNNHLSDLLSLHCSFENNQDKDKYLVNLTNGILAAEDHFGISKTLLGPADVINGTGDEHSLMIYIALLKRKVSMLVSSSLSSDEDEFIKISTKKQSPNTSILSVANSVYSERSSLTNFSHLSTPQPPHHQYASNISSYKTPSGDTSPSHGNSQDITPEKSDSGISITADPSSSSSLPSITSSRLQELREHTVDARKRPSAVYVPSRTEQPKLNSDTFRNATVATMPRNKARYVERRHEDFVLHTRDLQDSDMIRNANINHLESSSLLYNEVSRREEIGNQGETSPGDEQSILEESKGCKKDEKDERCRDTLKEENMQIVHTPEDELLHLLDTIGEESQHLRLELTETQRREAILKTKLEEEVVGCTKEEKVISKLVQELEMLRTENRRLFRESANAKNVNAVDRKTMEKLNAAIVKLQMEVEHQSAENFSLRMKSKIGSDIVSEEARSERTAGARANSNKIGQSDYSLGLGETSELCALKRDFARLESQKEFLQVRLKETEEEMTHKLNHTTEKLRVSRLENLRLEKECKLLRMSNETSHLEVETVAGRCRRLEEYLLHAQKRNVKLAQQLEEDVLESSSQDGFNQNLASLAKLKEENALLEEKVELAEGERELLKQELTHYRLNKTALDEVLRAWDIHTNSKFQSFLDDFRLHIDEQREHQETKMISNPKPKTLSLKNHDKQLVLAETQVSNDVTHSSSSILSENSEQGSGSRKTFSSASSRESLFVDNDQQETKRLTAENLAAVSKSEAAVDDKYLQVSPQRVDTDTEVDSEMDSQATENAFSDLLNEVVEAGGIAKIKLAEGFRRPSLGDLIVAKATDSPSDDCDAIGKSRERHSKLVNAEPKRLQGQNILDQGKGETSIAAAESRESSRDPSRSHLANKTRFSAVNSSMESLKGITQKAKLNPDRATTLDERCGATAPSEKRKLEDRSTSARETLGNKDESMKAGGDNLKSLEIGHVEITNVLDQPNQTVREVTSDSKCLPVIQPSLLDQQRVGQVKGRFSRWRRMQNRSNPVLDGSYFEGIKLGSEDFPKSYSEQKLDLRNRSRNVGSPLNASYGDWNTSGKHSAQSEDSETGTNSLESEEEFARLPERRKIAQEVCTGKRRVEDPGSEKPSYLDKGNVKDESKTSVNGRTCRMEGNGSAVKPYFSSPQRLGYLRSKFGIKLEKELLSASGECMNSLNEEQLAASSVSSENPTMVQPTNPTKSLITDTQSLANSKESNFKCSPKPDKIQSLSNGNSNTEYEKAGTLSNSSSPDVSKMSPASYNRYYKHKMMAEKDQEYANSIIDKYLNHI
ncbi:uncharacterized protein LOC119731478 isoform X2 [Patiria miniata]|uniref:Calponin-homology (CH) domain-containing protein n=1 Tax=Patiria miniata TaxID=46514 RepID=A0A914AA03_PATMI|nr:uncharacterized protein LOC119731478 isoform X2 [Patiria miniata]